MTGVGSHAFPRSPRVSLIKEHHKERFQSNGRNGWAWVSRRAACRTNDQPGVRHRGQFSCRLSQAPQQGHDADTYRFFLISLFASYNLAFNLFSPIFQTFLSRNLKVGAAPTLSLTGAGAPPRPGTPPQAAATACTDPSGLSGVPGMPGCREPEEVTGLFFITCVFFTCNIFYKLLL